MMDDNFTDLDVDRGGIIVPVEIEAVMDEKERQTVEGTYEHWTTDHLSCPMPLLPVKDHEWLQTQGFH